MIFSKNGLENIKRGLKRSWQEGGTHRLKQQNREIDADTLRKRVFYDRKGKFLVNISIYYSTKHSKQFDVFIKNKLEFICGPRNIMNYIIKYSNSENNVDFIKAKV